MPKFKQVKDPSDAGSMPSVDKLRESQRKGSEGTGFDESYADKMAARNHGTGLGEGKDQKFPETYAGEDGESPSGLPWE